MENVELEGVFLEGVSPEDVARDREQAVRTNSVLPLRRTLTLHAHGRGPCERGDHEMGDQEDGSMPEHPNAAMARQMADALSRGDMETLEGFLADDVIWHEIGSSTPVRGKAAMAARTGSEVDYQITGALHDVVSSDDHTIALVDATATRGGKTFSYRTAEIYHVKDGKIVERWAFSDDTAAITAFFA